MKRSTKPIGKWCSEQDYSYRCPCGARADALAAGTGQPICNECLRVRDKQMRKQVEVNR